ncbi:MAG: SsrA-binding protein [Bacteroidetes bacterium HGW-Bacteroidetes-21]|jgi:SsrA-binding protein|nr:MAG: SsrA-binding protein [Bacteroidetes bacterium HGW-Bacteroidetes-21]
MESRLIAKNKKASFEFELFDRFTAGAVLTGSEIKSIREGKINFSDAFCLFIEGELFLRGLHIAEYSHGGYANHEPKRDRKLLLTARELRRIEKKIKEKGFTIVPLNCVLNEKGFAKFDIAVARGKNSFDKRETLKKKDQQKDMDRAK